MCDYREGQLLLAHFDGDPAGEALVDRIRSEQVDHVLLIDDMRRRQERAGLKSTLPLRVYLLQVPEGQEFWKANFLHHLYRTHVTPGAQARDLFVVPNSYLTLEGFTPSVDHASYKAMLGSLHGATGAGVTVAIVDSGIEPASRSLAANVTDLVGTPATGDDRVGHGTVIANVVRDLAPGATVHIFKITDAPTLVEFDALAALDGAAAADVINLSLSFGNKDRQCTKCGRQSISSRSIVFEIVVQHALAMPHQPIVVAAAGNQSTGQLRYPARFGDVVAIGAVDAAGLRASYSNYGAVDAVGNQHAHLFFAPGGEPAQPVGSTSAPLPVRSHHGTSCATAYASGVIACARETRPSARATLLNDLRSAATPLPGHSPANDGNGLLQGI